jgi:hypothetical protein
MRLAFVFGLLALGFVSATPARADFAVVTFNSGYCRVYADTAFGPPDGRYLSFWSPVGWIHRFLTWETANMAMQPGGRSSSLLSLVVRAEPQPAFPSVKPRSPRPGLSLCSATK